MRSLKAILIEEGLIRSPRRAYTRIDRSKVDQLVKIAIKDWDDCFEAMGLEVVGARFDDVEFEEGDGPDAYDFTVEIERPTKAEVEGQLAFPAKLLRNYPELLDREFSSEVLKGVYKKEGPKQFFKYLIPEENINDWEQLLDFGSYVNPTGNVRYEALDCDPPTVLKDPYLSGAYVIIRFNVNADFELEPQGWDITKDWYDRY